MESASRRIGFRTMSDHAARTRNAGVVVKQLEAARAALRRQDDEKEALEHTMRVRPRPPAPAEGSRLHRTHAARPGSRARARLRRRCSRWSVRRRRRARGTASSRCATTTSTASTSTWWRGCAGR